MRTKMLICLILLSATTFAQSYYIPVAGQFVGWNMGFKMQGITVEPTRITVHTVYQLKYNTRTLRIPSSLELYIPAIYRSLPVTSINGASFGDNTMKSNKKYTIDFVCAVDWHDLIKSADNALFVLDIRTMTLTTNPKFTEPQVPYDSRDWRFGPFRLPITVEQQVTLACANYLSAQVTKGEFETTAAYNARLHADSLKNKLLIQMSRMAKIAIRPDISRVRELKPTLSYNADTEILTLNYNSTLLQPVQIKIPADKAKALKEGYLERTYLITDDDIQIAKDGNFIITAIRTQYYKSKETQTFPNILDKGDYHTLDNLSQKVFEELTRKHPNGKLIKN